MTISVIDHPSENFDSRDGVGVDMVVLHYTGMASGAAALRRLCDRAPVLGAYKADIPAQFAEGEDETSLPRVSAHYVVERDGAVFALVGEEHRAWHAGVASWAGAGNINQRSIGIEIVNGGHDFPGADGQLPAYADAQIQAVRDLVGAIVARHYIPPWRVLGHSDVAPGRKRDPGEHFPWLVLDQASLALSAGVSPGEPDMRVVLREGAAGDGVRRLQKRLGAFGYGIVETGGYDARTRDVVSAFQQHFCVSPSDVTDGSVWTAWHDDVLSKAFLRARHLARVAHTDGRGYAQDAPADGI